MPHPCDSLTVVQRKTDHLVGFSLQAAKLGVWVCGCLAADGFTPLATRKHAFKMRETCVEGNSASYAFFCSFRWLQILKIAYT